MIDYSNKSFLAEKESQVFNYTGDVLKIHLLAGVYKFECAGFSSASCCYRAFIYKFLIKYIYAPATCGSASRNTSSAITTG